MKDRKLQILLIDDDDNDRLMIRRALKRLPTTELIHVARSGKEAIAYFKGEDEFADRTRFPFPNIVLTDLKMPDGDGFDVLAYLKSRTDSRIIPVLVLSGSRDPSDVKIAYALGASCYVQKPSGAPELNTILKLFCDFWLQCEVPAIDKDGVQVPVDNRGKLGERFSDVM